MVVVWIIITFYVDNGNLMWEYSISINKIGEIGLSSKFTIKIMGQVFESDEDGMLDLNDIWRGCNLPENKRPSEWKSSIKQLLTNSDKIRNKAGRYGYTKSYEEGAIAYAMFVSDEFYLDVITAFKELRKGNIEEAVLLAAGTMSKEDEHLLIKFSSMKGLCFTKSCWYANIEHPNKLLNYLKRNPNWKYFAENKFGKLYATEEGIDKGIVYNCYGEPDTSKVVMRFTQKGRDLLRKNNKHFNGIVKNNFSYL